MAIATPSPAGMSSGVASYSCTITRLDFEGSMVSGGALPIVMLPVTDGAACMYWNEREG